MKEMNVKISHGSEAAVSNGGGGGGYGGAAASDPVSSSRVSSLLASKDRDYLLSPTGNQVSLFQ
ncbi:hypothetical protein C1H46_006869 [Malus baccata]|uniref:Uncharacterized protein n=1 Tax=Malus baccata TaxID=106549 RepID=A0A540N958_MALBA|nr:hypothetical protein C1H46_006869 [Malus baccata]